ncbi:hypothetical protein EV177_007257, partial [Coemansia sp. RSA 1804]
LAQGRAVAVSRVSGHLRRQRRLALHLPLRARHLQSARPDAQHARGGVPLLPPQQPKLGLHALHEAGRPQDCPGSGHSAVHRGRRLHHCRLSPHHQGAQPV